MYFNFFLVKVFSSGEFIHVLFSENLLNLIVENLIDHLFSIFILETILDTESFGRFDDHIELVGSVFNNELAFNIERN